MISFRYCVLISVLVLRCASSPSSNLTYRPHSQPRCYVETLAGKSPEEVCDIRYTEDGCSDQNKIATKFFNENWTEVLYKTTWTSSFHLNVSLSIRAKVKDPVALAISGITAANRKPLCITIFFCRMTNQPKKNVTLHANLLELPEGAYNLTGIRTLPSASLKKRKQSPDCLTRSDSPTTTVELRPIAHRSFSLRNSRNRRDYLSSLCFIFNYHNYSTNEHLLKFYRNHTDMSCDNFTVTLLKCTKPRTEEESCLNLNVENVNVTLNNKSAQYSNKIPIEFRNIPTGCYILRAPGPNFYGFIWVEATNFPQTQTWNTRIIITPRSLTGSLEIRWEIPKFPSNFSSWLLRLFYHETVPIKCSGRESESLKATQIIPDVYLQTKFYMYTHLEKGYYCALLIPADNICLKNRCSPIATETTQLKGMGEPPGKEPRRPSWVVYVFVSVGIVIGVSLAVFCYSFTKGPLQPKSIYDPVTSQQPCQLAPIQVQVLIIWAFDKSDREFENVISSFKHLLKTYSNCKIYDYLDYGSMDSWERQSLLTSPTEWLHKHIKEPHEKIIFIGSRKTVTKRELSKQPINGDLRDDFREGYDEMLFECAVRYLKESLELSSNYSRIFYVRFPGLYKPENDFEEIVPWMRFDIPNHLRSLTLRLQGLSDETSSTYPDPPENDVIYLQTLISNCKNKYK